MTELEKVIKDLEAYRDRDFIREGITVFDSDPRYRKMIINNALELLKEQEAKIEQLNRFVNGFSRDAIPVVRCMDCKHRGNYEKCVLATISKKKDFPLFILDNRGEWFCADGERK